MSAEHPEQDSMQSAASTRSRLISPPSSVIWMVGIAVMVLVLYISREVVLLLLLAGGLAYLINPLVKRAESVAMKREVAVTLLYLMLVTGLLGVAYFLVPRLRAEVNALSGTLPSFTQRLDEALDTIQREVVADYPAAHRLFPSREARYERLNAFIEQQTEDLPHLVGYLATIVVAAVIIPFASFFLLRDSRKIIKFLMDRLPSAHVETSVAVSCEIDRIIGRYLRGLTMDCTVVGAIAALGLWMLGVNYPMILGAFTGLANAVPYLGPILGGGAAMLVALVQFKSLAPLGKVLILYLFVKLLDDVAIQPATIGGSVHLHPLLLLTSVIVGEHVFGLIGMLIAVPVVTVVQEVTKLALERRRYRSGTPVLQRKDAVPVQPYVC